jgi:arylsulfatase A-like enzyme/Flp pilus assembly protein TadD
MSRTLRAAIFAALFLGACRRSEPPASSPASPSPSAPAAASIARLPRDVVLVTIDTLRYDAVGFDGNSKGTTPNLDRLAAEGEVFSSAHAHNVITLPSHTNILTGLFPWQHGVRDNAGFRLSRKVDTLATMLKSRGYATGAFVSAFPLDSRFGLTPGFDVYEEMYKQVDEPEDFEIQQARAEETIARALDWFGKAGPAGKPRFLWVHLYDPHAPYDPPEPWKTRFAEDAYLGEVAFTDASLRPLLDAVQAGKPAPFLVVTADHGEARGDHGELTHGLFTYEATLHVPLLLWCPDLVKPGRDARAARHVDIVPTVLDAIGAAAPSDRKGRSLLGPPQEDPAGSYFESLSVNFNRGWAPLRGLLLGGKKFIDLPLPELYDLPSDPSESKNLVETDRDAVRRTRKLLLETPVGPVDRGPIGSEEAEKLRNLGYLSGEGTPKTKYGPEDDPKNLVGVDQQLHQVVELFQQEKAAEAIPIARRLVAEHPTMKTGYLQLAFLLAHQGDRKGALAVYEQAAARGLAGEGLRRKQALLLCEVGRPAEGAKLLEPYRQSEDLQTLNALGIALTDAGRPAEGLTLFERALTIEPRNSQAHQNAGIALLRLDRLPEAREQLEAALATSRRSPRSLNALGVVYSRLGEPAKAMEAWSRCVEVDPQQYDALYNLGRVAGNLGDWTTARSALERFAATAPPSRYGKDIAEVKTVLAAMNRAGGPAKENR